MSGLYEELKKAISTNQSIALATIIDGPEHIGAKLLVYPAGRTRGTLGIAALDELVQSDAIQAIWHGEPQVHSYTISTPSNTHSFAIFIEGFAPSPELIIVGAGHIAIPLTVIAKALHYYVVVIDARAAFATSERFPQADELIVAWPDEVLEQRPLFPSTAVAVLTHDPKFDEPTLRILLARHTGYIGAIGSHTTSRERAERLKREGISDEQLARIHGPIGLGIGATTPEEIALAIMAEVVAVRHQNNPTKGVQLDIN